ncbi:MAG: copper resistance CopC/CopD family protein [Thermomicrobiales bacterium]
MRRLTLRFAIPLALCAVFYSILTPTSVSAHAEYDHSNPAANAIVATAPSEVDIWFTERLEPAGSSAQLFNKDGQPTPASSHMGGDPKELILTLPSGLANGTYSVVWSTLSADDGHPAQGYFTFTIGTEADVQSVSTPTVSSAHGTPQWIRSSSRWAALLGLAAAVAVWPVWLLVLRPSYAPVWQAGPRLVHRAQRLAGAAFLLAFAGDFYALLAQAGDLSTGTYLERVQTVLTDTRYGKLWILRIVLLAAYSIALLIAAWWWPRHRPGRTVVTLLIALALPLPFSLDAHASAEASGRATAIATDYVHLLAASVWIGGLFLLVGALVASLRDLTPAGRRVVLSHVLPRFSTMALTAWGVLILTGAYQAWLEVGNLDGLLHTSYGRTLGIKVILLVPLLALAAFNLILVTRKIRGSTDADSTLAWTRRFTYAVGGEVILVILVLLVVGRLTSLPPARGVLALQTTPIELALTADGKSAKLTITPGAAGPNDYTLALAGWSPPDGSEALLRLTYISQDIGEKEVKLTGSGDTYTGSSSEVGIAGDWRVDAIVRKIGAFQWQASTQTAVPAQPARAAQPRPAWRFGLSGLIALVLVVLAVAALVVAFFSARSRLRLEVAGLAACALLAAALLFIGAHTTSTSPSASTRAETPATESDHSGH